MVRSKSPVSETAGIRLRGRGRENKERQSWATPSRRLPTLPLMRQACMWYLISSHLFSSLPSHLIDWVIVLHMHTQGFLEARVGGSEVALRVSGCSIWEQLQVHFPARVSGSPPTFEWSFGALNSWCGSQQPDSHFLGLFSQAYFRVPGPLGARMFQLAARKRNDGMLTFEDLVVTKVGSFLLFFPLLTNLFYKIWIFIRWPVSRLIECFVGCVNNKFQTSNRD